MASTAITLLLTDSSGDAARYLQSLNVQGLGEVKHLNAEGRALFAAGNYSEARKIFLSAVAAADRIGDRRDAALNWNNAGSSSLHALHYKTALDDLSRARQIAEEANEQRPLSFAVNNLASLYLHLGAPEKTILIARQALRSPAGNADAGNRARLQCELGAALMQTHQETEAIAAYREGINGLLEAGDFYAAAIAWGMFGDDSRKAGNSDDAEKAYIEGLRIEWIHRRNLTPDLQSGLARVLGGRGDETSAANLFDAARNAPPGPTPRWRIYADRGHFNLDRGHLAEALADFRQARSIATRMRADMVPADLDRVNFENGLGQFLEGLVDAGNRLARQTGDHAMLAETFDAAEQDHLWSLRSLVPSANDWRSRLPEHYWNLLARYQSAVRNAAAPSEQTARMEDELRQIEIAANKGNSSEPGSALARVRALLDSHSVFFSFHLSKTGSWVWAADEHEVDVYPLPPLEVIEREAADFEAAVRTGPASAAGARLYKDLFGSIAPRYIRRPNWRLELDGPLYEVPFPALVVGQSQAGPVYLIQRATIEAVPGALLMSPGGVSSSSSFLGIGDPVYNTADARYHGPRLAGGAALPRLPNTACELEVCARNWSSHSARILSGPSATASSVENALARNPDIVHFATHVVSEPGEFRSGLIALSLAPAGTMDVLGPKEIVAHRVSAKLVVMNGCHSAQGQALPGAGLMGLTRAWIGAGASAVMATQWDVPDDAAQSMMATFYSSLRSAPDRGFAAALREAELNALQSGQPPAAWAAYSLLSRIP